MNSGISTVFLILIFLLSFDTIEAQTLLTSENLESFLTKAELQSQKYTEIFKDLSSEETKTKLYYKKNGLLDEKRIIKSLFVVYRSPHDNRVQEFRNVLEFNGRTIDRANKETERFLKNLGRSSSAIKEHIRIRKRGIRFDGRVVSWGMTLDQPRPFSDELKPFFEFKIVKKGRIMDREIWVIKYNQTKQTLLITSSPSLADQMKRRGGTEYSTPTSEHFRPTNPLMNGKLWLDAKTGQIWRNEFEIVLRPAKLSKPVINVEIIYEYQPSKFGILVPERFFIRGYRLTGRDDKTLKVFKDAESIYEYSKFSRFTTDAKIQDISKY
jgi:hypothetical protein